MLSVTKMFTFCYAHHLPGYEGKCKGVHGHNATLEVEFDEIDFLNFRTYKTMVLDFNEIKKYVQPIVDQLDHKNMNDLFEIPTCESMTEWFVEKIKSKPIGKCLIRVRLYEGPTSYVEWRKSDV